MTAGMTKAFWLSFTNAELPPGQQFLGACVIDVSEHEAARWKPVMSQRHRRAKPGAEWLYAAMQKSWTLGINPGGSIASAELPPEDPRTAAVPRDRLLTLAELQEYGTRDPVH